MKKYALQHRGNGDLICIYDETNVHICEKYLEENKEHLELIDATNASHLLVTYTELGGPWGYGHQEPSFETYGSLKRCIINLYKWMQNSARVFGPDARDIRDFFKRCSLNINGTDKTDWIRKQADLFKVGQLYT